MENKVHFVPLINPRKVQYICNNGLYIFKTEFWTTQTYNAFNTFYINYYINVAYESEVSC